MLLRLIIFRLTLASLLLWLGFLLLIFSGLLLQFAFLRFAGLRFVSSLLLHLFLDGFGQLVECPFGVLEGLSVITEHGLGGLFDAFFQIVDVAPSLLFQLASLWRKAFLQ